MPHTLLLADDSVTIQRVIELTFADEDIRVVAVSDGDQAVEFLESAPPDIVLADIGMPGRDGYEVARYIRQSPRLAHIPVVLLTGAFEPVDQAKATEVGCDGVLAKPFEPQLVIGRVKELLSSGSRRSVKAPPAPPPVVDQAAEDLPASEPAADLDDYFDRLDSAFANLSGPHDQPGPATAPPTPAADLPLSYGSPQAAFEAPGPAAPPAAASLATPEPPPDAVASPVAAAPVLASSETAPVVAAPVEPVAPVPAAPAALAPVVPPAAARPLPTIGEAFAVILAAEQETGSSGRLVWPAAAAPAAPEAPTPELSETVLDAIAERVLARLSDRVVRERVTAIAERMVADEIERIKAAIK